MLKRHLFVKRIAIRVLLVIATIVLVLFAYAKWPTHTRVLSQEQYAIDSANTKKLIEAGRDVAITANCIACHSASAKQPFAGGVAIASPIGTIYSTNITPDRQTGIGYYNLAEFDRALRYGILPSGRTLYPAMPYPSYANLTDEDVEALYVYMMNSVRPVNTKNRKHDIVWPLSTQWPLALWRKIFVSSPDIPPIGPDVGYYNDPVIARGAYLVQAAGHCGSCHTPRGFALQEKTVNDRKPFYLSGGQTIDGWTATSLRGNSVDGLGRWSEQDIIDTLKTARNSHAAVSGTPMANVVRYSTQWMSDQDLIAIAKYLKTLPAYPADAPDFYQNDLTTLALRSGQTNGRGPELYLDNCAACHRSDGTGATNAFPVIAGNPTVLNDNPASLIRLILTGSTLPATVTRPSRLAMPGFAWRLTDEEVAELATFVRQSWGNQAKPVNDKAVKKIRHHIKEAP